ncbi:unnamed protein product [Clonostachys rosea]|uniref:K Homology domain-containing protein n=1 Tax=Bionectria ochroleuca TaxID=29856 RepID=A0ABY6TTT5_BIOOC|nr:unnamed protein product [Clonostachys rosea]
MDEPERPPVKRSRFDQTEPEPKKSRFDRRSRSPPSRRAEGRDRSPLSRDGGSEPKKPAGDAAAAAAAAAARINAQLQAKKGIQHVDVPPIRSESSPAAQPTTTSSSASNPAPVLNGEMYVADGDYIQDIEVNDLRNRYLVTKGSTQKMNPPLYLHITSTSKEGLELAVQKVKELIQQDLPQLVDDRRLRRRDQEPVEKDEFGRRKWRVEKVPIDLEPIPGFNLRAQVVGHGGAYVKHIQQETGCRVQIKGRGSGYLEASTNKESDEEMYLNVTGPDSNMIDRAKELCEDLIANVKEQYEDFKTRPPRHHGGHGEHREHRGHGNHGGHGGHGGYGGHHGGHGGGYGDQNRGSSNSGQYGYGRYGSETASSNSPAPPGITSPTTATDYAAQYAQYYGGQDPYAPWGGYQNNTMVPKDRPQLRHLGKLLPEPLGSQLHLLPRRVNPLLHHLLPVRHRRHPHLQGHHQVGVSAQYRLHLASDFLNPTRLTRLGYPSHDAVKEPHAISLKVLRLSRPSLVPQYPFESPESISTATTTSKPSISPASLAYSSHRAHGETNSDPFLLSPIVNLPVSFGSAYVGETFSCTLCANNDLPDGSGKSIRDVRIDAEMKTPAGIRAQKLELSGASTGPLDLAEGETLQGVVTFDLKEEGNHVLAVTVSYYEASETSGRTRTFRKLYQFICKPSLIVRTKVSALPGATRTAGEERSRWVLEAQLENCSDEVMQLEKVAMECEAELAYRDCNWGVSGSTKPVLHPGETEQLCFVVNETEDGSRVKATRDGRIIFGVLGIGWRGEMGNRGFLSTGKLAAKAQVEV